MKKYLSVVISENRNWHKILLRMKFILIILIAGIMQVSASVYSQSTKFSFEFKDEKIVDILREIEDQSDFRFLYQNEQVDVERRVSLNITDATVENILSNLFKNENVTNKVFEDNLVLIIPEKTIFSDLYDSVQQKSVSGTVVDKNGQPLPGVTIFIKGTTAGTISDSEGKFQLEIPATAKILQFSFVGMKIQEIAIGDKTQFMVVMESETYGLEEVVVVGYGTQKKINLTGAVSTVSSSVLEDKPIATMAEGLQGAIPSLNINFHGGDPGRQTADLNIRGYESINGGSPYVLIDGVPMNIQDINPADVESITVLKDAAASAIYGAKAGFGVILVTTKGGQSQDEIEIRYNNETAFSTPILKGYDVLDNSHDYVTYQNIMANNDRLSPMFNTSMVEGVQAYYEDPENSPEYAIIDGRFEFYGYNNWMDMMIRDFSPSYKNNLSISGGTKMGNYFVSVGNYTKEGIYKIGNDTYSRNNLLMKLNQNVTDWLSFDQKLSINMIKTERPYTYNAPRLQVSGILTGDGPTTPLKFPENDPLYPQYAGMYFDNIAGYYDEGGRDVQTRSDMWMTAGMNLRPVSNLNIRTDFSYNMGNSLQKQAVNQIDFINAESIGTTATIINGDTGNDFVSAKHYNNKGYIFNAYAEYEIKNIDNHYIKAMVGFNQEWRNLFSLSGIGYELITPALPNIATTIGTRSAGSSEAHYALRGAFYRLNYIYKEKYLVELNGRYDGTSRFPKNDRFGFFPSASVGWRISEEGFMSGIRSVLNNLKVRASYGQLGNQELVINGATDYYPYIASMPVNSQGLMVLDNDRTTVIKPAGLVSPTLTWETIQTQNIGLDFALFKHRLDGSFDYFIRDTKDMLLAKVYPYILATAAPLENGAGLRTKGWEFMLSWNDRITNDFSYHLRFSLWDSQSEITKYINTSGTLFDYYEGMKIGEIWGYETEGLFQSEDEIAAAADQSGFGVSWYPGDLHYSDQLTVDTNDDGIPDEADGIINSGDYTVDNHGDMMVIGNSSPRYSYGFNLDVYYKNWSLGVFIQGIGKRDYAPGYNFNAWWPWDKGSVIQQSAIDNYWSPENPDAYWFLPTSDNRKNRQASTRYLQDASYLRLKSLTLQYSLPQQLIGKIGLSKAQVFISGQNLWTHSNLWNNRDPESMTGNSYDPNQGIDIRLTYPLQRTYNVGVNLIF